MAFDNDGDAGGALFIIAAMACVQLASDGPEQADRPTLAPGLRTWLALGLPPIGAPPVLLFRRAYAEPKLIGR